MKQFFEALREAFKAAIERWLYVRHMQAGGNPETYEDELVRIFKLILEQPRVFLVD